MFEIMEVKHTIAGSYLWLAYIALKSLHANVPNGSGTLVVSAMLETGMELVGLLSCWEVNDLLYIDHGFRLQFPARYVEVLPGCSTLNFAAYGVSAADT
jgi:hypothetical protein